MKDAIRRFRRQVRRFALRLGAKRSLWAHYLFFVLSVLFSIAALTYFATSSFRQFFVDYLEDSLAERLEWRLEGFTEEAFNSLKVDCRPLFIEGGVRLTAVRSDGTVLCDSTADAATMANHRTHPEVAVALSGRKSTNLRYSNTIKATLLYVAMPIRDGERLIGVLRAALPLTAIELHLQRLFLTLSVVGMLITLLIAIASWLLYRRIISPLHEMRLGALRLAQGRFDQRLPEYEIREISELANSMNIMGTKLHHLEQVRRDFVANVSHELKTPITAIRGFVETLLEGAKDNPEDLTRFLQIVEKQSERMRAIVDDLLTLSKLEGERASELLLLREEPLGTLLREVADLCSTEAQAKGVRIEIAADESLQVYIDRSLVEQALINLVMNAIRFSPSGGTVQLVATEEDERVRISVIDQGPGIEPEHLGRLFERFYRADRSRARSEGGTGLGLAIVKHIVALHGGKVRVTSEVGSGSVFNMYLPFAEPE